MRPSRLNRWVYMVIRRPAVSWSPAASAYRIALSGCSRSSYQAAARRWPLASLPGSRRRSSDWSISANSRW